MQICNKVNNYETTNLLGKGTFGKVYKGHDHETGTDVAIKMIPKGRFKKENELIEREVNILKQLTHPNIVQLIDYYHTQNIDYLIFEFCMHGDLEKFIDENYGEKVPEFHAQKIIQQIIEGVKFMKEKKIVHRDLKLANFLVAKDFVIKIADFGLSNFIEEKEMLLESYVGTPLIMAPEILARSKYNEKCDIWSLGIIFYEMMVGKIPFNPGKQANTKDLLNLIKVNAVKFPNDIPLSSEVKDLICRMLVPDENSRMTFEELFQHDWITGVYKVQKPYELECSPDPNASVLLKSAYDQIRLDRKIDRDQENNMKINDDASPNAAQPLNYVNPDKEKAHKISEENINSQPNKIDASSENKEIREISFKEDAKQVKKPVAPQKKMEFLDPMKKEVLECIVISKIYEFLIQKCETISNKLKKISQTLLEGKIFEVDYSDQLNILIIVEMLNEL